MAIPSRRKKRKLPALDPHSLTGKVFYFSGLQNDEECHGLNRQLILIYDDQHESEPLYSSSHVFGFIINNPDTQRLGDAFRASSQIVNHRIQSIEIMNTPDIMIGDQEITKEKESIFFITPRTKGDHPIKTDFRKFSAYECETLKIAEKMALGIKANNIPHIATYGFVTIDRELLTELERLAYAKERPATAAMVFAEKPSERTFLAFPDEFNFKR